jgi:hypothetical protein
LNININRKEATKTIDKYNNFQLNFNIFVLTNKNIPRHSKAESTMKITLTHLNLLIQVVTKLKTPIPASTNPAITRDT